MKAKRLPWLVLFVLTGINLLNYIDRYIFSALLPAIKDDLKFTDTELGLLGSGFVLAYLVISPIFGFFGDRGGRSKLMAMGLALWSGATAATGLTTTFMGQLFARIAVGVGESAYSVIAPSVIADYFKKNMRGKVFALYAGAIPVGSAFGYVLGGWLEPIFGWQKSFMVVGIPGVIMAFLLFFMRDPKRGEQDIEAGAAELKCEDTIPQVYQALFTNGGFVFTVLGYSAYTFVVGGMAFWMPSYIVRYFEVSLSKGNLIFGGITVLGGVAGTVIGGLWSDRIENRSGNGYMKVSVFSMIVAAPLFWLLLQTPDFTTFAAVLFVFETAVFLCISPLDAAIVNYVRPVHRATAMALTIFLIHLLGDGISRVLMGAVSDASDLRTAIGILPWVLLLAGAIWLVGILFFWFPMPWPKGAFELPKRQAHRGYRPTKDIKENTLAAFHKAYEAGAEMIECDVHLCKDGEPVVFHDSDLQRAAGRSERVEDLTSAEMAALTGAPRLRDVLTDLNVPRLINIELKKQSQSKGKLEAAVARVVKGTGTESRVLFSSFEPLMLRRISKHLPDVPRAFLLGEKMTSLNAILGMLARPHLLHPVHTLATPARVRRWKDRDLPLAVWTVNDPKRIEELERLGVDSMISDDIVSTQVTDLQTDKCIP